MRIFQSADRMKFPVQADCLSVGSPANSTTARFSHSRTHRAVRPAATQSRNREAPRPDSRELGAPSAGVSAQERHGAQICDLDEPHEAYRALFRSMVGTY